MTLEAPRPSGILSSDIRLLGRFSIPMVTQFKRIQADRVMCTVDGCGEAATFLLRYRDSAQGESAVGAYCEVHAKGVAKHLGFPLEMSGPIPTDSL